MWVHGSYFQEENEIDCGQPSIVLKGPPGYQGYKWMNDNFTITHGTTQDVTVPGPMKKTKYALILTPYAGFGCPDTFYTVYYISNPKIKAQSDTTVCSGDNIQLQSTILAPVVAHLWSPPAGLTCPSCPATMASPQGTTTYYHEVTDATGCTTEDTVLVIVDTMTVIATADTVLCAGDTLQLDASSVNGFTPFSFSWSPTAGLSCTNCPNPLAAVAATTTYTVTMTNSLGCTYNEPVAVKTDDSATADIMHLKDTICIYEQIELTNSGANANGALYAWYTDTGTVVSGGGTKTINVFWSSTGAKTIRLNTGAGLCSDTDTAVIVVVPPPIASFDVIQDNCLGTPAKVYPRDPAGIYYWTVDGIEISDTGYHSPMELVWNSTGTKVIHLRMKDRLGCSAEFTDSVVVHPLPVAEIDSVDRISICNGIPALVTAVPGAYYVYQWDPAGYFPSNNSANVTAHIHNSGYITLTTIDQWGCSDVDSEYISTEQCCDIDLPDAFTPNNDGVNDQFRILHSGDKKVYAFMIVNRWGKAIFESNDMRKGWDGNYNGIPQDAGTYFYYLKYECDDKPIEKKDSFILIR